MVANGSDDDDIGFGPLEELVRNDGISDIAVTEEGCVWVDMGQGMRQVHLNVPFTTAQRVKEYAIALCAQLGKRLDDSCPIADASTAGGIRVHAVIEPIVRRGAALSIRIPSKGIINLLALHQRGFMPLQWVSLLRALVIRGASIIISGATGAGKTTLLRALLNETEVNERIIVVEEIREIGGLERSNLVSLACREANVERAGEVGLSELVKATLRMRPDRIVLGECRGEEVADLLRAFNTGHRGGMVTVHCSSVERLPQRLVSLAQLGGIPAASLFMLAQGAFDVVLQVERIGGVRRLTQIGCMEELNTDGIPRARVVSAWRGSGAPIIFPGWESFSARWDLENVICRQVGAR